MVSLKLRDSKFVYVIKTFQSYRPICIVLKNHLLNYISNKYNYIFGEKT